MSKDNTSGGETQEPTSPRKTADAALQEALRTPISQEDAAKAYADLDVARMKLLVIRQKWQAQIAQYTLQVQSIDEQLTAIDLDRAVIFRRSLISPDAPAMGEPVGGESK